jgi:ketosteroid isomerase-like protein
VSAATEVVERLSKAFDAGDTATALDCLHPDIEFLPIRAQLDRSSYRGHEGYLKVLADFEEDWEGLHLVQEDVREAGDRVVATGRLVAKGRGSGVELDVPLGLLYEFRDGKVVRLESFSDPDEALRAAGIED